MISQQFFQPAIYYYIVSVYYRMSTQVIGPARSMSYNEIKKRRHLRESKSKEKLKYSKASVQVVQTQKKVYPNPSNDIYACQKQNDIQQIKQLLAKKTFQNIVKDTVKKINKVPQISFTQRVQFTQKSNRKLFQQVKNGQEAYQSASKQILRDLIQQAKSQRKLLKYNELRNKFKLSKSRSRSRSCKSLLGKSKMLMGNNLNISQTPQKPQSPVKGVKHSHHLKKFQTVKQHSNQSKHNFRYLVVVQKQKDQFFKNKSNKNIKMMASLDPSQSSIQIQKRSQVFDEQQNKVFRQLLIEKDIKQKVQSKQNAPEQQQKILDLLQMQPKEVYKYLGQKQRQKKLVNDLQKLNKKFPKGFFKF